MRPPTCATSASRSGGKDVTSREGSVVVALKLIDEADFDHRGYMDFVDNVIDRSSGTIRGRAVFSNPTGVFTPGMFARIRVPGSPAYAALLVPDAAIGTEQARKYVLVVDGENVARHQIRDARPAGRRAARHQGRSRRR